MGKLRRLKTYELPTSDPSAKEHVGFMGISPFPTSLTGASLMGNASCILHRDSSFKKSTIREAIH